MALLVTELHQNAYSNSTKFCRNMWLIHVLVYDLVTIGNSPQAYLDFVTLNGQSRMLGLSCQYFDYDAAKLTILVTSKLYFVDMTQPTANVTKSR